ncbi:MAG: hypothetical protein H6601_07825 [Flavobacteriales bacterium]|nr:hypothetical protein [Flavobacteriales bacterium]MCB9205107.1 hypothetical protein [Flavobacteriales bacterium]
MLEENRVINSLWIGSNLSSLELLTLNSFVAKGHEFHLWVYEDLKVDLPKGVVAKDANEIITRDRVFQRKLADPNYGIGKGSFGSPFSDLFRYYLLYQVGGWWVDMDVTCLKPFNCQKPYFFRSHPILPMIGNVMKTPKGSELMKRTYEQTLSECSESTKEWLKPNKILNTHLAQLGLSSYIQPDLGNHDWWEDVAPYLRKAQSVPKEWIFIHWMNEEWRNREINKFEAIEGSVYQLLLANYGIPHRPLRFLPWWKIRLFG